MEPFTFEELKAMPIDRLFPVPRMQREITEGANRWLRDQALFLKDWEPRRGDDIKVGEIMSYLENRGRSAPDVLRNYMRAVMGQYFEIDPETGTCNAPEVMEWKRNEQQEMPPGAQEAEERVRADLPLLPDKVLLSVLFDEAANRGLELATRYGGWQERILGQDDIPDTLGPL